ncbi:MAG TPA: formate/nitrite transporter family protein [Frankiaceae bacterium]|nr:formate/nitrite transporter family protein [Frankiaceae bacterium]
MAYKTPQETTEAAVESGVAKASSPVGKVMVGGFLAGAYIAFGSLLAISVTSGLDTKLWGTLPTLVFGAVFSLGLILVILAGSDLLTGNMALLPVAAFAKRIRPSRIPINWALVFVANLIGSVFVAYFLAIKTGVIGHVGGDAPGSLTFARLSGIAHTKAITESDTQIFLRAVACNWLVCLALWLSLAAQDIGGKILGIFFPITAFVAMGFDHVVANMFFLPAAMFAHVPGLTWTHVINNLVFAFIGNVIGAVVFVAGAYWFLHLRGKPAGRSTADSDSGDRDATDGDGLYPRGSAAPTGGGLGGRQNVPGPATT